MYVLGDFVGYTSQLHEIKDFQESYYSQKKPYMNMNITKNSH